MVNKYEYFKAVKFKHKNELMPYVMQSTAAYKKKEYLKFNLAPFSSMFFSKKEMANGIKSSLNIVFVQLPEGSEIIK